MNRRIGQGLFLVERVDIMKIFCQSGLINIQSTGRNMSYRLNERYLGLSATASATSIEIVIVETTELTTQNMGSQFKPLTKRYG